MVKNNVFHMYFETTSVLRSISIFFKIMSKITKSIHKNKDRVIGKN